MKKILINGSNHIVNGIKYTIPLIVMYSVFSALVGNDIIHVSFQPSDYVFVFLVPVLTAFIAHSISPKITFLPGLFLGYFLGVWGTGYIGGILGGLFLGYLVKCISSKIQVKQDLVCFLLGYIALGGVGFVVSYYAMYYLATPGILLLLQTINHFIASIPPSETMIIVLVLALFTTLDLGGPINKIAYGFIIQFYVEGFYHITGPVLVAVMLPPFGVFIGLLVFKNRFSSVDHQSKNLALIGALFGLTEGALAVSFRRPFKVLPIVIIGSMIGSVIALLFGLENTSLLVGLPSFFTINSIVGYLTSVALGTGVMMGLFYLVLTEEKTLL